MYSISDESGRGVYRVDFSPKKYPKYGLNVSKYNGSAYFDRNSLRLKQIKADQLSPSSWNIVLGKEDKKRWTHTSCVRYKHVFEEVSGTLVVKHIEKAYCLRKWLSDLKISCQISGRIHQDKAATVLNGELSERMKNRSFLHYIIWAIFFIQDSTEKIIINK